MQVATALATLRKLLASTRPGYSSRATGKPKAVHSGRTACAPKKRTGAAGSRVSSGQSRGSSPSHGPPSAPNSSAAGRKRSLDSSRASYCSDGPIWMLIFGVLLLVVVLVSWLAAATRAVTKSSRERTSARNARMSSDCGARARQRWPSVRSRSASSAIGSECRSPSGEPNSTTPRVRPRRAKRGPSRPINRKAMPVARCSIDTSNSPAAHRVPIDCMAGLMRSR